MPVTFGRYELLKRIAGGGMGEVFVARQRGLAGFEKLLVIKTLLPHLCEDEEFIHMFQDEARISAQLIHPNICQTFEFEKHEGTYYIAMEYLRGEDVRRLWKAAALKGIPVPVPLICRIIADAASGLDFAHALKDGTGQPYGIVHRDISPQNILVTFEGGVKLIDFGVAKAQGRLTQTRTGAIKGKYSYMSPEQVKGEAVDHKTDIFALGIVLHELLTAQRLFKADSDISTIERVKSAPIPPPSTINPSLPRGIDIIVLKALARDPAQRFENAQAFRLAIEDWLVFERMSASSAHLAEFLKRVYRERLDAESSYGPLGEPTPATVQMPGAAAAAAIDRMRISTSDFVKGPPPAMVEAENKGTVNERASRSSTPSGPTDPKSVIDLSMVQTDSGSGPFKGYRRVRAIIAGAVGLVILVAGVLWLRPRPAPPAPPLDVPVAIVTEPAGALLAIDGRPVGASPFEARLRPGTTVRVDATLDGHSPAMRSVPIGTGGQRVEIKLEKLGPARVTLLVKSEPEDAEVSDGARILGKTPFNWSAGKGEKHVLKFHRPGYRDHEEQITVGSEAELKVRLRKLTSAAKPPEKAPPPPPPSPDQAIKLER